MRKADNLIPSCAVVTKSGNLNFLEHFGPVQACNGTALPLPLKISNRYFVEKLLSGINSRLSLNMRQVCNPAVEK